ncbi:MAG: hypothetical protein ACE144_20355 [Thermodesulfobacteriota bacterium]
MFLLNAYFFLYSGFASFWSYVLGYGSRLSDNSANITIGLSVIYLGVLWFQRKVRVNSLTYFILGYILLRGLILLGFAASNGYDVLAYVLPLKNWFALLFFFVIGQSIDFSFEKMNRLLFTWFALFVVSSVAYEVLCIFIITDPGLSPSRLPILKYRVQIDLFLTTYVYMISTMQFLSKHIPVKRYFSILLLIAAALLVSQIQQALVGIILVSLFISFFYFRKEAFLGNRPLFHVASILLIVAFAALSVYTFFTYSYQDIYFSAVRRNLLIEYVKEKALHYPLLGYPIPSPAFSSNIPFDIWRNFFDFNFDISIFPADIPSLFLFSEEGILGALYVVLLLWLCYRRNPDTKYLIFLMLATITNFRLYYLITLVSSFTYFLLGYFTSDARRG